MIVTKCIVCGGDIEHPRHGKMYCSDTCKTRAYIERKKKTDPGSHDQENDQVIMYTFDYNEFKAVKCDNTFEVYCFLRKNLAGEPDLDFIKGYIKEFDVSPIYDEEKNNILYQEYQKFLKIFHATPKKIEVINRTDSIKE